MPKLEKIDTKIGRCYSRAPVWNMHDSKIEAVSKIVDYAQARGANRFESGAYTTVFEHFESV